MIEQKANAAMVWNVPERPPSVVPSRQSGAESAVTRSPGNPLSPPKATTKANTKRNLDLSRITCTRPVKARLPNAGPPKGRTKGPTRARGGPTSTTARWWPPETRPRETGATTLCRRPAYSRWAWRTQTRGTARCWTCASVPASTRYVPHHPLQHILSSASVHSSAKLPIIPARHSRIFTSLHSWPTLLHSWVQAPACDLIESVE